MDAWWPRIVDGQFKPVLGPTLFGRLVDMIDIDDEPNAHGTHVGSSYMAGWYAYVERGPAQAARQARPGGLLAYLLRRRRPRAAARSCARPSGRRSTRPSSRPTAATRPATRARTRASTTSGASTRSSTPGRRHYPAADPLDQPPDLPAGRRGRRHHGGAGGGEPRGDGTPGDDVIRSGSGDDRVDGGGGFGRAGSLRPGRGPRPRRSPRSARRRARTPRRPAPACRRRGARAGALATTGSRRTRGGP